MFLAAVPPRLSVALPRAPEVLRRCDSVLPGEPARKSSRSASVVDPCFGHVISLRNWCNEYHISTFLSVVYMLFDIFRNKFQLGSSETDFYFLNNLGLDIKSRTFLEKHKKIRASCAEESNIVQEKLKKIRPTSPTLSWGLSALKGATFRFSHTEESRLHLIRPCQTSRHIIQ